MKAIIANKEEGKLLDIMCLERDCQKIKDLAKDKFYIIYNVKIWWQCTSQRKVAQIDELVGEVKQLKVTDLDKYEQKLNWFTLKWNEKNVTTDYKNKNIQFLNVAGYVNSVPTMKKIGLYTFWIKNTQNQKIMVNYWGKEAPEIEPWKVYVFTCVIPKYHWGTYDLTINGPWYLVPWKWNFSEQRSDIALR